MNPKSATDCQRTQLSNNKFINGIFLRGGGGVRLTWLDCKEDIDRQSRKTLQMFEGWGVQTCGPTIKSLQFFTSLRSYIWARFSNCTNFKALSPVVLTDCPPNWSMSKAEKTYHKLLFNRTNLLSSSSTQWYPHAAAVSKFLSSHSSVAGSVISDSASRCTPYLSPKRQMKNGAQRPILSRHMRRTCSLFCWDWLLFHRRSTGRKDVPRSRQSLFSLGNTCSCRKSLSTWKSWNVEHTNGRITWLLAAWPRAADKLDPSLSIGISCKKMTLWLLR